VTVVPPQCRQHHAEAAFARGPSNCFLIKH
jgi:hypothetical protein